MWEFLTPFIIVGAVWGAIGAFFTIHKSTKTETFTESVLSILIGSLFGAGAAGEFGQDNLVISGVFAVFAGAIGGVALEAAPKLIPDAVQRIIDSYVDMLVSFAEKRKGNKDE